MSGIPMQYTSSHKVCKALCKHGKPVTLEQGIEIHGYTGSPNLWQMRTLYKSMVKSGYLLQEGETFQISKSIERYFDGLTEIEKPELDLVKKRTNLSKGELPVQKRDPRIRPDIFFKTVGAA